MSKPYLSLLAAFLFCAGLNTASATECQSPCSGFRTQTQGGWGASPNGNNPAVYLFNNFSSAFPNGLEIGCNNTLKLTSASSVKHFLPTGGPPSQLPSGTMTNPNSYGNVLAGQLVALTLSVGFDNYDPNFGSNSIKLKDLIISGGTFQGKTVQFVLDEANSYIGGCGSNYTASQLNNVLSSINENYVDGDDNEGFLECPIVINLSANVHDVKCSGDNDGYINLTVSGGNGGYSYLWSNGATTQDLYWISTGVYSVTVTSSGTTETATYTVDEPAPLELNETITDISCNGNNNGSISLDISGGNGWYTTYWSDGNWGPSNSNLSAGNYTAYVWDYKGCSATETFTISQATAVTASIASENGNCTNGNLGSASVSANGAVSYSWSNGATTSSIDNLSAGNYSVTVTSADGCTATASTTIGTEGCCNVANAGTIGNAQTNCGGFDPATISSVSLPSGGTGTVEYIWTMKNLNGSISVIPGATGETFDPGYITETTKYRRASRMSGCSQYSESNWVIMTVNPVPSIAYTVENGDCANGNLGSITASSNVPASYAWSNGATTATINGLSAGNYSLTVTSQQGCTSSENISVSVSENITVSGTVTDATCNSGNDGSIDIEVSGGTLGACAPVAVTPVSDCSNCTQTASGNQSLNIGAGQKICILEGTSFTGNINMSGGELVICGNATPQNFSTTGGTIIVNGSLQVNVINLHQTTHIYNYGSIASNTNITGFGLLENYGNLSVTGDLNNNNNGTFTNYGSVSVSSNMNNSATGINNGTVHVSGIFQNNNQGEFTNNCSMFVSHNFLNNSTFTNNGSIACSATSYFNGSGHYYMGAGATHSTVHTHVNGNLHGPASACSKISISGSTTINGSGNLSGHLDFCDQNGIETNTGTLGADVTTDCSCQANGSSGGTYGYTWSNGATTSSVNNLPAGQYSVTVTDGNGCSTVETFTVSEPSALEITMQVADGTCTNGNKGSIATAVNGSTGTLSYLWSNGETTAGISDLDEGSYSLTITDGNGCSASGSAEISVVECCNVTNGGQITGDQENCGSFDPTEITSVSPASGGLGAVEYVWLQSETLVANTPNNPHWTVVNGANGLSFNPGTISNTTYFMRLSKSAGCVDYAGESNVVEVKVNPNPTIAINTSAPLCHNSNEGSATAQAAGGSAPFSYSWSTGAATASASNLSGGDYHVTVTDAMGCIATAPVTVAAPAPIVNSFYIYQMLPFESYAGEIEILGTSGGSAPHSYIWDSGDTNMAFSGLDIGWYFLTTTDANGCVATDSIEITNLPIFGKGIGDDDNNGTEGEAISELTIFPNPIFGNTVQLGLKGFQKDELVSMVLTDMNGRIIQQCGYAIPSADWTLEMPIGDVAPGTYFLRFTSTSMTTVLPVSVAR